MLKYCVTKMILLNIFPLVLGTLFCQVCLVSSSCEEIKRREGVISDSYIVKGSNIYHKCWSIENPGNSLDLELKSLNLQNRHASDGNLTVELKSESKVIEYWSQSQLDSFTTTSSLVEIHFKVNSARFAKGRITSFRFDFKKVCRRVYTEIVGNISSPGYPDKYPNDVQCVYIIRLGPEYLINITFHEVDIVNSTGHYDHGYLEILDGETWKSQVITKLMGNFVPDPIISTNNYLMMVFKSGNLYGNTVKRGFYATYSAVKLSHNDCRRSGSFLCSNETCISKREVCDGIKNCENGADEDGCGLISSTCEKIRNREGIVSESYTSRGSSLYHKCWTIENIENNLKIEMDNLSFQNKPAKDCNLTIELKSESKVFEYWSQSKMDSFTTTSPLVVIHFKVNSAQFAKGRIVSFRIRFKKDCSRVYTEITGNISSPGYPDKYAIYAECIYEIRLSPEYLINITFHDVDLITPSNDDHYQKGFLQVRDGDKHNSPLVTELHGNIVPDPIISTHNYLRIQFSIFYFWVTEKRGFHATYSAIKLSHNDCRRGDSFQCSNETCVPKSEVCDGIKNCENGADEVDCDNISSEVSEDTGPKISVQYSLFVGDERDVIRMISLRVPENYTAFDVMELAKAEDDKFNFKYERSSGMMYVYEISGVTNNPDTGLFWLLYQGLINVTSSLVHYNIGPDQLVMQDKEHLVMWYKNAPF